MKKIIIIIILAISTQLSGQTILLYEDFESNPIQGVNPSLFTNTNQSKVAKGSPTSNSRKKLKSGVSYGYFNIIDGLAFNDVDVYERSVLTSCSVVTVSYWIGVNSGDVDVTISIDDDNGSLLSNSFMLQKITPLFYTHTFSGVTGNIKFNLHLDTKELYKANDINMEDLLITQPCALPIELIVFEGHNKGGVNKLNWVTATEISNDYFAIERSLDAVVWEEIGTVEGHGNSNTPIMYEFDDTSYVEDVNYYRLKQTDFNGDSETFYPISIKSRSKTNKSYRFINSLGQEVDKDYTGFKIKMF